jgi:hypothetical protein
MVANKPVDITEAIAAFLTSELPSNVAVVPADMPFPAAMPPGGVVVFGVVPGQRWLTAPGKLVGTDCLYRIRDVAWAANRGKSFLCPQVAVGCIRIAPARTGYESLDRDRQGHN